MLYEEDLPVTAENVALSSQVKELKETKDSVLAARIADQMAEGVQPEKANLVKLSVAEAVRFKRRLAETQLTMTADAIRTMSEKGISIDVTNLEDVVEKLRACLLYTSCLSEMKTDKERQPGCGQLPF